jgi:hypothetical protein
VTISFVVQKFFFSVLCSPICPFFLLVAQPFVLFRNSWPMPNYSSVSLAVSCTSFKISGITLRSLIHFELILVQGKRHGLFQFSACRYPVFQAKSVEEAVISSIRCFGCLCQKSCGHSCVDSYLGLLFYSTGLHIYFGASHAVFIAMAP